MLKTVCCWHVANRATVELSCLRSAKPLTDLKVSFTETFPQTPKTPSNLKCAKVLTRFPSSGKLNVIRFVIDSELLAPPDSPPEICCTFDCVSLRYKVAPQCNELFIICRRFASLKKITFCSGSGRPPRCTLGGNAFKRTSSIREEERRDARRGPHAKKVDASLFLFPLFIRKMHLAAVFSKLIYVNKGGTAWVHFKKKKARIGPHKH